MHGQENIKLYNWIGQLLRWNRHLKHVIDRNIVGKVEGTKTGGRRRKQLLDDLKETRGYGKQRENFRSHSVGNSLWKTYRKADNVMNE